MRLTKKLQVLLSYLVAKHACQPPDQRSPWTLALKASVVEASGDVYTCPECGALMVRSHRQKSAA